MAMPAFIPFLKTPTNLPPPKENAKFSIQSLLAPEDAGDSATKEEEENVEYDKIMVDHFNPAFKRPVGQLVVRVEAVVEMMGLVWEALDTFWPLPLNAKNADLNRFFII